MKITFVFLLIHLTFFSWSQDFDLQQLDAPYTIGYPSTNYVTIEDKVFKGLEEGLYWSYWNQDSLYWQRHPDIGKMPILYIEKMGDHIIVQTYLSENTGDECGGITSRSSNEVYESTDNGLSFKIRTSTSHTSYGFSQSSLSLGQAKVQVIDESVAYWPSYKYTSCSGGSNCYNSYAKFTKDGGLSWYDFPFLFNAAAFDGINYYLTDGAKLFITENANFYNYTEKAMPSYQSTYSISGYITPPSPDAYGQLLVALYAHQENSALYAFYPDSLFVSTDQGDTWLGHPLPWSDYSLLKYQDGLYFYKKDNVYYTTSDPFSETLDVFINVEEAPIPVDFPVLTTEHILITHYENIPHISDDKGITWTKGTHGKWLFSGSIKTISEEGDMWVEYINSVNSSNRKIYRSHNQLSSWERVSGVFTVDSDTLNYSNYSTHKGALYVKAKIGEDPYFVYRSNDWGNTWMPFYTETPVKDFFAKQNRLYIITTNELLVSVDEGTTWITKSSPTTLSTNSLQEGGNYLLAQASSNQSFWLSTTLGDTWQTIEAPSSTVVDYRLSGDKVYALESKGAIWTYHIADATWIQTGETLPFALDSNIVGAGNAVYIQDFFVVNDMLYLRIGKTIFDSSKCNYFLINEHFISKNGGETWKIVTDFPASYKYQTSFNNQLYFVGDGIWTSPTDSLVLSLPDFALNDLEATLYRDTLFLQYTVVNNSTQQYEASVTIDYHVYNGLHSYSLAPNTIEGIKTNANKIIQDTILLDSAIVSNHYSIQLELNKSKLIQEEKYSNNIDAIQDFYMEKLHTVEAYSTETICEGEAFNNVIYNEPQLWIDTFYLATKDSIHYQRLDILPHQDTVLSISICESDSLELMEQLFTEEGFYFLDELADSNGCDSLVYLDLNKYEESHFSIQIAVEAGSYYLDMPIYQDTIITTYFEDENGCEGSIQHELSLLTSTTSTIAISEVHIFPNPFQDELSIQYVLQQSGITSIHLLDTYGRKIHSLKEPALQTQGEHQIQTTGLDIPAGIYFLEIRVGEGLQYFKVVK